jgi:phage terminase large subunit-like protein
MTTACIDWQDRIINRRSLIVAPPLYPDEAAEALEMFKSLRVVDAPGQPTFGETAGQWVLDLVASIFGAYNKDTGVREIGEFFLLVSKKNGKAVALDTPIPTPSGWTTMGDLQVGDQVFDVEGLPCNVIATSEVFIDHKCYEMTFSNGESVIADAGHLWVTKSLHQNPGSGQGNKRLSVGQDKTRTRTTEEIANTLFRPGDCARNHSMQMPAPIVCPQIDLPIAPYTLGAWLGDGSSGAPHITCHEYDDEIIDTIRADGYPVRFFGNNGSAANTYTLSTGDRSFERQGNGFAGALRRAGVLNNKHIPSTYFRASFSQRLALLQGMMDTDGTINKNGRVLAYSGVNERLVRDFRELLSTFGIKSSFRSREVTCNGVPAGIAFEVQFMAFRDEIPCFRLGRKLHRMNYSDRPGNAARSRTVHITGCSEVPSVPVKCIAVDSPDRQFLFGRTMLPTHNSLLSAGIMLTALLRNWRQSNELIIVAPSIKAANNSFKPAADMVRADPRLDSAKGGSLHVIDHERKIKHLTTGATLQVLSADAGIVVGVKAGFVLIDEMWQFGESHKANAMLREATGGLVTRPEGFIMTITTQSDKPPAGEFKDKLNYARDVRDGKIIDPRFLPVLYEFPPHMIKSKAYLDLNNAYITNPYLAYEPVAFDWLKQEMKKELAKDISSQNIFLSKHLNVEIGQGDRSDRWAGAEFWPKAARKGLTYESVLETSELVCVGIDGGGLDDLFGFSVIGRHRETKQWQCWSHAWAHVGVKERRKSIATRLDDFDKAGELTFVDDELKDLTSIIDLIADIKSRGILAMVSVDPAGLGEMIEALAEIGVTQDAKNLYASPQGGYMMNAIKTAERMLVSERMVHDGSDLMSWCVSNLKIEPTATTIRATKQTAGDAKIDPVMAMFNAVAAMVLLPAVPREKEYQILVVG